MRLADDVRHSYMWMADRWNEAGPGGLDNATLIWLPLAPAGYQGLALVEDICNASDPNQLFTMAASALGRITHVASGLCPTQGGGNDLVLGPCSSASQWTPVPDVNNSVRLTNGGEGSDCYSWNAMNDLPHSPGNPIISYQCSTPGAWNELWLVPARTRTGFVQAAYDYRFSGPSNLCATVQPLAQIWNLSWFSAWSLKDF